MDQIDQCPKLELDAIRVEVLRDVFSVGSIQNILEPKTFFIGIFCPWLSGGLLKFVQRRFRNEVKISNLNHFRSHRFPQLRKFTYV